MRGISASADGAADAEAWVDPLASFPPPPRGRFLPRRFFGGADPASGVFKEDDGMAITPAGREGAGAGVDAGAGAGVEACADPAVD